MLPFNPEYVDDVGYEIPEPSAPMIDHEDNDDHISSDGSRDCAICFDANRDHAFIPCGHLIICEDCKDSVGDECPICKDKYIAIVKIFR